MPFATLLYISEDSTQAINFSARATTLFKIILDKASVLLHNRNIPYLANYVLLAAHPDFIISHVLCSNEKDRENSNL